MHKSSFTVLSMTCALAGVVACESPCKPGYQRYGVKCVRSPDAGGDEAAANGGGVDRGKDEDGAAPCERNVCGGCADIENADDLGAACESGKGDCKEAGAWVCDGKDALKCSGAASDPQSEACGGGDEDCDGKVDETTVEAPAANAKLWFADCDGDTFIAARPFSLSACGVPPIPPSECTDERAVWRNSATMDLRDCADTDARAFPGQKAFFGSAIAGKVDSYDFDCDGVATPDFAVPGIAHIDNPGCDRTAQAWIIADNDAAQTCYDTRSGYANACGTTPFTVQRGFLNETEVGPLRCGGPGPTICDSGYGVPIVCH